jgi:hypothetical protein
MRSDLHYILNTHSLSVVWNQLLATYIFIKRALGSKFAILDSLGLPRSFLSPRETETANVYLLAAKKCLRSLTINADVIKVLEQASHKPQLSSTCLLSRWIAQSRPPSSTTPAKAMRHGPLALHRPLQLSFSIHKSSALPIDLLQAHIDWGR